jgi:hypothetical protein
MIRGPDTGQPHGPAMLQVGVFGVAGLGTHDFFEHHDGAGNEGGVPAKVASTAPLARQQSALAPGVELHAILLLVETLVCTSFPMAPSVVFICCKYKALEA